MKPDDRERWDRRYREDPHLAALSPAPLLVAHAALLPRAGRALDIACGAGRNAFFLASHGLTVTGVDVSPVGLGLARETAKKQGQVIDFVEADLSESAPRSPPFPIAPGSWDVIVCNHYLERALFPVIEAGLKPGGILFFETFTIGQLVFPEAYPRRPEFLLHPNELLRAFPGLHVIHYEERPSILAQGERAIAATLFASRAS